MPALVLLGRQLLIASDDVPLFALPAALFHSAWTIVLIVTLALYQRHPVCRDEGDYLPFLAGGAGAFTISSALEWTLFKVGLTGTPLETHARRAVPLLLYLHTFASVAELGFAAYGARLLHVDTRLCTAWSPRPLAAALVGTTWAVIALNGLLTALALNPWHGLGLVEAWEARLLWLARLLCCRSRLLTHAGVPDRDPALRRIAQLTSHLLQHVDLTLSDVAAAMILVAAAQRERRLRALRDAMVAAVAAHSVVLGSGAATGVAGPDSGSASSSGPGFARTNAPDVPQVVGTVMSGGGSISSAGGASKEILLHGSGEVSFRGPMSGDSLSPFLAVQQLSAPPSLAPPGPPPPPPQQQHPWRQSRVRFAELGTELAPVHAPVTSADVTAATTLSKPFHVGGAAAGGLPAALPCPGGISSLTNNPIPGSSSNGLASFVTTTRTSSSGAADLVDSSASASASGNVRINTSAQLQPSTGTQSILSHGSSSVLSLVGGGAGNTAPVMAAAEGEQEQPPSPSRALTLMYPIVHITPAGMEEHLEELVGELVTELTAEAAEAAEAVGEPAQGWLVRGVDDRLELDLNSNLVTTRSARVSEEAASTRLRSVGSVAQESGTVAGMVAADVAVAPLGAPKGTGSSSVTSPPASRQPSFAVIRKRIGDAALAAAFAAEREMVDRETLQEAAVYGRYAAAIYGSCPPDGPSKSAAWHLGGDGDGSSPDEVAAWRRRHGSSAPDPLLASILSSASKCTEHVVHVNTHNSTEGYLPYMVCLDKPTRSVVIAIRGTFSAEDIVTDCLCEPLDVRHLLSREAVPAGAAATPTAPAPASAAPAGVVVISAQGDAPGPAGQGACEETGDRAAEAFNAAVNGVPSDEAVLVHAGIWAAADVIWEDLRQLRLLDILLPPPGLPPLEGQSPAGTNPYSRNVHSHSKAPAAAVVAGPDTRAARDGLNGPSTSTTCPPAQPSTDSHALYEPPQRVMQVRMAAESSQELPPPSQQQRPQRQRYRAHSPPQPSSTQQSHRWRSASLDEDRVNAFGLTPTQLTAPPRAAYGAGGGSAGAPSTHHGYASLDVSGPPNSFTGPNLPRLVSAERQATMPHDSGLSALLLRRQQRLPPPPPPAAALLPSLVLSYHPPARTTSMLSSVGTSRPIREPTLRRGKSTTAGPGSCGRRTGGSSSCGRSSADGDEDDNDPRAPLLLSSPPLSGRGPTATGYSLADPALQAARTSPPRSGERRSSDVGVVFRRPGDMDRTRTRVSPSRLAAAAELGPGSSSTSRPVAAARQSLLSSTAALPPPGSGTATAAVPAVRSTSRYARAASTPPTLWSSGAGGGAVEDFTKKCSSTAERSSPGLLTRVGHAVLGFMQNVSALVRPGSKTQQQPRPQQAEEPQPPQHQNRVGWLRAHSGVLRPASEGGEQLPYMSLPHMEVEAEEEGQAGIVGSYQALARRWRSAGGAGHSGGGAGGVDGGVVDGWSINGAHHSINFLDVEAATLTAPAAPGSVVGPNEEPQGDSGAGAAGYSVPLRLPEVNCTGWRLVVTGHSLGAGAAALLALRLRSALPHVEVRCWAFSPPGSLTSPALSEALRPFTVSVVTGKDLIPRLSLNTMERYRDEMITALARCRSSKARVLVGSFSRRNRLRRAAHLLLPYHELPHQARQLLRNYHEAVLRAGRLPELHPPGRILYLQPSARSGGSGRGAEPSGSDGSIPPAVGVSARSHAGTTPGSVPTSVPHYRPVWVSARELLSEGILASTRMLVDHSLTLCTLPALDEILST